MITEQQINEMWEEYKSLLLSTKRPGIENLISWLEQTDFKTAPSSQCYHSACPGGLLFHSLNVYKAATHIKNNMCHMTVPAKKVIDIPEESIIIAALLHDLCKVNFYKATKKTWKDENEPNTYAQWKKYMSYTIEDRGLKLGHGTKSLVTALQFIRMTEDEMLAINWHMGVADPGTFISPYEKQSLMDSINSCALVEIIILSDHFASFMMEEEIDQKHVFACD